MVENGFEVRQYLQREEKFSDHEKYPTATMVLSDVKMPFLDGFELLAWIRRRPSLSHVPVILLSSSDLEKDIRRAYGLGANTFFTKPLESKDLQYWANRFTEYWCSLAVTPDDLPAH